MAIVCRTYEQLNNMNFQAESKQDYGFYLYAKKRKRNLYFT